MCHPNLWDALPGFSGVAYPQVSNEHQKKAVSFFNQNENKSKIIAIAAVC